MGMVLGKKQDKMYHKRDAGVTTYTIIIVRETRSGGEWIRGDQGKEEMRENFVSEMARQKMGGTRSP